MQRLQTILRCAAAVVAGLVFALFPTNGQARVLAELQTYDPTAEAPAPADPRLAASCRTAAQELLGEGSYSFGNPVHTSRAGETIIRMDLIASGAPRGQRGGARAVCTRDPITGTVDAAIFDGPTDAVGPRVIILSGPTPEMRPRKADTASQIIVGNPTDEAIGYETVYTGGYYGAGFGFPDAGSWCRGCGSFAPHAFTRHAHGRSKIVFLGAQTRRPMFVPDKRFKSDVFGNSFIVRSAPFFKPALRSGATVRLSIGFAIR